MATLKQKDKYLKKHGMGGMDDPNLVHHLAFMVRDHEHFRQVLVTMPPQERTAGYEAMKPYLQFEAKPLDVYMAESAELASQREINQTALEVLAEKAIIRSQAVGTLTLTCTKCTKQTEYPGRDRREAEGIAHLDGWDLENDQEICPKCAEARPANA